MPSLLFCRYRGTTNCCPSVVILRITQNLCKVSVYLPSETVIWRSFLESLFLQSIFCCFLSQWRSLIRIPLHGQCWRHMENHRYIFTSRMLFHLFSSRHLCMEIFQSSKHLFSRHQRQKKRKKPFFPLLFHNISTGLICIWIQKLLISFLFGSYMCSLVSLTETLFVIYLLLSGFTWRPVSHSRR